MNDSSISSKAMPPALEMARSIDAVAPTTTGTAFTSAASAAVSPGNALPHTSRNSATAVGDRPSVRFNAVDSESFGRRRSSRVATSAWVRSGCRSISSVALPVRSMASRTTADSVYTGPPSRPSSVIVMSPRTVDV